MLISSHGTHLQGKGAFNQKDEETAKGPSKKKMVVMEETRTLNMNNNYLNTVAGLGHLLKEIMFSSEKLLWIDLSHNHLTGCDEDIFSYFPQVKTLYLHANYIVDFTVIQKFSKLSQL